MSKYKYGETEQKINNVLQYQSNQLREITFPEGESVNDSIRQSEELLKELGIDLPLKRTTTENVPKKVMIVPSWDSLCKEAEKAVGNNCKLENLFTEEELRDNDRFFQSLNDDFNQIHRLDKNDIAICVSAGLIAAAIDILMTGIPHKTTEGLKAGPLSNYIRDYFNERFPEEEMEKLANSKVSKVPFDAQDNRNTEIYVDGLSSYYHRLLSLGHDPLIGFLFGVIDIVTGRMTTIDKTGRIVSQVMPNYADRTESDVFFALAKLIRHYKSDITTSMGLPAPLMSLFNLCQFGSIGEEEQTIAEIVQGMYYEGYDFIHFCSQSIPVMIVEVITRIGYAFKRIKEGNSIKESIPFSTSHEKHPKLGTMLFMGHSAATSVNAGKVYFTGNPMAINYPQWIAFAKYTYQQLKWILIEKPELRDAYVQGILNEQLDDVLLSVDNTFNDYAKDYIVIYEEN